MIHVFRSIRFTPSLMPTIAAFLAVALTAYLGHWQQGRAAGKRATQQETGEKNILSPVRLDDRTRDAAMRHRRAIAAGEWQAAGQIFIDNQVNRGIAGFHVITPLKITDTDTVVLVNRGWIARDATYPLPPSVKVNAGLVSVSGKLSVPSTRFLELSNQSVQGAVWQNLTIERYQKATHKNVLPFVLLAQDATAPLEIVNAPADAGADKHVEYMLTWYSLSATVIVLWLVLNTRRVVENRSTSIVPAEQSDQTNNS